MKIQVKDISETTYGFYNGEGWSILFINESDLCLEDRISLGLDIDDKYNIWIDAGLGERE